MPANRAMASRYARTVAITVLRRCLASKPFCRPATTMLVASLFTSHSHGPGVVSSKSLRSNISRRSGEANVPKLDRWASPQSWTPSPETGAAARSMAIIAAAPR